MLHVECSLCPVTSECICWDRCGLCSKTDIAEHIAPVGVASLSFTTGCCTVAQRPVACTGHGRRILRGVFLWNLCSSGDRGDGKNEYLAPPVAGSARRVCVCVCERVRVRVRARVRVRVRVRMGGG